MLVSLSAFANNGTDYEGFDDLADPSEYVYGDCIWCPSQDFVSPVDSNYCVEITLSNIINSTIRVAVTDKQSYITTGAIKSR